MPDAIVVSFFFEILCRVGHCQPQVVGQFQKDFSPSAFSSSWEDRVTYPRAAMSSKVQTLVVRRDFIAGVMASV